MPPVAAVLIGAVATGVGAIIAGLAIETAIALAFGSFVLGLVQVALAPDAPNFQAEAARRTQMVREAVTTRRLPFGEVVIGGKLSFYESTDGNRLHHMVVTLGDAPAAPWDGMDIVWLGDTAVFPEELDGGGNVVAGKFAGKVRIKKLLGGPAQVADADLIAEIPRLDANFRGQGVAAVYARIDWNGDLFPNGLPSIRVLARTNTVVDTRDQIRRWTPNATLALHEYVTEPELGLGYAAADMEAPQTDAGANVCDEIVDAKAAGHAVVSVDIAGDTLELAVAGTGAPLRLETGDQVELFVNAGGSAPGGLSVGIGYFAIVARLVGANFEDVDATTIALSAGNYIGAAAAAITAGDVDAVHGPGIRAAVRLATTYAGALARTAIDITSVGTGQPVLIRTGEPRYTLTGVVDTARTPKSVIEAMQSSMAGRFVWTGGTFRILPAAFRSPTLDLDESDLMGPMTVRTRHSRRNRFNAVRGIFATHLAVGESTDYPSVIDAGFATADGGKRIFAERDRPWTSRAQTAQRLGKIDLARHRREFTVEFPTTLKGLRAIPGTVVRLSNVRRGWVNKTFEVVDQEDTFYGSGDPKVQGVILRMVETDALVYDFDPATDETIKPPKPIPPGGNPFVIALPTGLTLTSGTAALYERLDGTVVSRIKVDWAAPADQFVTGGGFIHLQSKRTADVTWEPHQTVPGDQTTAFIIDVEDGVDYVTRIRSVNVIGVRSDWVTSASHTVIGKTAPPSNVTGFGAQQNGAVVTFSWDQIPDKDTLGYEIKRGVAGVAWDDADEQATKGGPRIGPKTRITTASVPPGTWDFLIKAIDTSENPSVAAARTSLTVISEFDIVDQQEQREFGWPGTRTGFVYNPLTGALNPDSTVLASTDTAQNVFDEYVWQPVASATYEAPEFDIAFDDQVRVWADIVSAPGPGEASADPATLELDYRKEADAYDGFEPWIIGEVTARRFKFKLIATTAAGVPRVTGFNPTVDLLEETVTALVAVDGTGVAAVTFPAPFHRLPNIEVSAEAGAAGAARFATWESVTTAGFTIRLFDSAGTAQSGNVTYRATGV